MLSINHQYFYRAVTKNYTKLLFFYVKNAYYCSFSFDFFPQIDTASTCLLRQILPLVIHITSKFETHGIYIDDYVT